MGYKFRYTQSVTEGGSSVTHNYFLDTADSIWKVNPFNSPWGNAGCYAGANPANGSEIGTYSVALWSGWNKDAEFSDMRDVAIHSTSGSGQQNLRFMAKFNSGGYFVNKQSFNWTNLRDATVKAVSDAIDGLTNYSEYDPYRRQDKNVSASGTSNSPLNVAPLESLNINSLIFLPIFRINEIEYYNYNEDAGGYANVSSSGATKNYTWAQIKPEDKTPAGTDYDPDLFEKGWTEITPVNQGGRRFRYCSEVSLVPYYGLCSNRYDDVNDSYIAGTNPDDGKTYGDRQIFGTVQSQANEYPVIGTNTNLSRPCLLVMSESYNDVTGGLVYSTPPGISFGNVAATGSVSGAVHALQPTWSIAGDYHKFAATTSWTKQFNASNQNYCNFYEDVDPITNNTPPDLSISSTVINVDIDISALYENTALPNTNLYYLPNDGPIAFSFAKNNRNLNATNIAFYSISSLWHTIASFGCYVADTLTTAQKAATGLYVGNNNHLYLGQMSEGGITNGIMIQGSTIKDSPQARIDDIIKDTPYTPVTPTPGGGGGGTDPSNTPSPSGKGEPKLTGDSTTGVKARIFGAGSVRYYALNLDDVTNFTNALWAQTTDFYSAIQIAGKQNTSIFNYISSYRYYPTSLSLIGITLDNESDVYLGTGAKFKGVNGKEFKLIPLSGFFGQFDWCSWSLASFPGWRNNFLDYSPYCKMTIYLPYAGTYDLDLQSVAAINDITSATINVKVVIDLNTGSMSYFVNANGILILNTTTKLGVDMPISGNDTIQQATALLQNNFHNGQKIIGEASALASNILSNNAIGIVSQVASLPFKAGEMYVQNSLAHRQIPTQVGGFGGTMSTITDGQDPYITIYRQKIANPDNYGHTVGYLTCSTHTVSSLRGFTVCENVDVSNITATSAEQDMIKNIMESGFYA